jgi:N utilization substance protein B
MIAQKSKRRIIREKVLQILYAHELNKESLASFSAEVLDDVKDKADQEFAHSLIRRVLSNVEELDSKIKERVENWELNRIALIDKILLRMGICELLYFPDIPPKVSINESIEIAKNYSTASSGKFINGILDAILAAQKKSGKLNKIGRGLVEDSISREKNNVD